MTERYWTAAEDAIAIRKRANKIGLAVAQPDRKPYPLRWVNDQRAELARLAALGMTSKAMADALGTTKNAVIGALWRHDIHWPRRGLRNGREVAETQPAAPVCNTVAELPQGGCSWLDGEPLEFRYCGKPIARLPNSGHGESYCAEHRAIVWMPPSPSKGRPPDFPGRAKW